MPIDFNKLIDPAYIAEMKQQREKDEAEQTAFQDKCRNAIRLCEANYDALTPKEGEFVLSLRNSMVLYFKIPSEKQQKWLFDLAGRFETLTPDDCESTQQAKGSMRP